MPGPLHEVLAIIPARGGSKGLPRKAVLELGGKPLIAYSIEAALSARYVSRVVVSTEDEEIAQVALDHGAEVPFLRPEEYSRDDSPLVLAINYTLNRLYPGRDDVVACVLFPTSPFRPQGLVDFLLAKAMNGYCPAVTVKRLANHRYGLLRLDEQGRARPLEEGPQSNKPQVFHRPYGLIGIQCERYLNPPYVHPVDDPVSLIDIDTHEDLLLARHVLDAGLFSGWEDSLCGR